MSEPKTDEEIRQELQVVAARARAAAAAEAGSGDLVVDRVTDSIRRRTAADARQREDDERSEAKLVAIGMRPTRMDHETREQWLTRLGAWEATPAGREWTTARAREKQENADRNRAAAWPAVVEASGVPLAFAELVAAGNLAATDPLVAIRSRPHRFLVLGGNVGVGKSVAAAWWLLAPHMPGAPVVRDAPARAPSSLWVSAARLSRWERYDDGEMARLLRAPRLVIDDLATEYADAKGNFGSILDEVVNDRLGNKRPLVITTNADRDLFRQRYGERIADRNREHGTFISFAGDSMRRRTP